MFHHKWLCIIIIFCSNIESLSTKTYLVFFVFQMYRDFSQTIFRIGLCFITSGCALSLFSLFKYRELTDKDLLGVFCIADVQGVFTKQLEKWSIFHHKWLCNFTGQLYPILYENLQKDVYTELKGLFEFLQFKVNETSLLCAVENKEGNFHRNKTASVSIKPTYNCLETMLANVTMATQHVAECLHMRYGIAWNYFPKRS